MWPVTASGGFFGDALERIWKKRIGILKERESHLVTPELLNWESDLKKAFEEPEIYQKIRETNTRYMAISHLIQLLQEHWTLLGSSSLELESRKNPPNDDVCRADRAVDRSNREKANDVKGLGGVEKADWTEKVNEQEQEHETSQEEESKTIVKQKTVRKHHLLKEQ